MYVSGKNILIVGVSDQSGALSELPVRVLVMDSHAEAIRCLRSERIDTLVSHWELMDCPDGRLLKGVREAKPSTPTIAFVKPGNVDQEVAARGLGVDAVLSEDIDADYFRETICQLLGIPVVKSIEVSEEAGQSSGSRSGAVDSEREVFSTYLRN